VGGLQRRLDPFGVRLGAMAQRDLLEIETKTSTGVVIRTSLQTSVSVVPETPLKPGDYNPTLPTVFENAPNAWEQRA